MTQLKAMIIGRVESMWTGITNKVGQNARITSVSEFSEFVHCVFDVTAVLGMVIMLVIRAEVAENAGVVVLGDNELFMDIFNGEALEERLFDCMHHFKGRFDFLFVWVTFIIVAKGRLGWLRSIIRVVLWSCRWCITGVVFAFLIHVGY